MTRRRQGIVALAALGAAAFVLLAVEVGRGALNYGEAGTEDPCTAEESFPGGGFDATVQRIVLSGLNGAACQLGTTREELVLSFVPELRTEKIRWDRKTIDAAVRSGLARAIDDAETRGDLGSFEAAILREVVRRAPLDWLIEGGAGLSRIFGP